MAVTITISRQMGSLGCDVAEAVARRLGFRMVWRDVINLAAARSGAHEAALAEIDELGLLGITPTPKNRRAYLEAVGRVMEELAAEGSVVIVGRAGQVILRDREDVLHVRIVAPIELRVERIAARGGVALDAARAQVEASDRSRHRYLMRNYRVRWEDPLLYDLVINTGRMSVEQAAESIASAASPPSKDLELHG